MRRALVLLAGVLACWWSALPAGAYPPPDTVAELVERLRQDPVQVNTMMGAGRTAEVDALITEAAARAPLPVYVVLDLAPDELEGREQPAEDLVPLLSAELGEGLYLVELGSTAESIIGSQELAVVGQDETEVLSNAYQGRSLARELADPGYPTTAMQTYLAVLSVADGGVDEVDTDAVRSSGWLVETDLGEHLEAVDERLIFTGVVALGTLSAAAGSRLRTSRARRRAGVSQPLPRRLLATAAALALTTGTATATWVLMSQRIPPPPVAGDQSLAAAEAFEAGARVWVSPDLQGWMTPERQARLEALAEDAVVPTRVAVWYPTQDGDGLLEVAWTTGQPGLWVSASPDEVDAFDFRLSGDTYHWADSLDAEAGSDRITFMVSELIRDSDEEGPREVRPFPRSDYYGGSLGAVLAVVPVTGLLVVPVGLVLGLVLASPTVRRLKRKGPQVEPSQWLPEPAPVSRRPTGRPGDRPEARRRPVPERPVPGRPADRGRPVPERPVREQQTDREQPVAAEPLAPPAAAAAAGAAAGAAAAAAAAAATAAAGAPAAGAGGLRPRPLAEVSSWEVSGWRRSAEFEVGNLERTLRFLNPTAAATEAATAARRHAEAAQTLVGSDNPADHLGALVLARRGAAAAAAATAGRAWEAAPGCWSSPLHPAATEERTIAGRAVPCCRACAASVDAGQEPEVLALPGPDGPVRYHDSGAEPWASTAYGALEPDLPGRLARS
ncbi:hypothetical protein GC722_15765 [Auraticoccus sp. F435]|uniref:TPM domain-containing protein n=1 Tax=Auraticoccus cholistanensis TaxID=2656650 RepID=A0A6A9UZK0_9ACTN|nr:hypothetical protein [Auraticoccus cholistanensis]MVA77464.1 hypothetical protein [Auraticoccus cholistanensis]